MRVVIIGAGHNGLAAAFYLARAGLRPLVLESRDVVGGGAVTSELHPGFRCPALAHHVSLRADVAREMELGRHGVELLESPVDVFAPSFDGRHALIYRDDARTVEALRSVQENDARAYPAYRKALRAVCGVITSLLSEPAPPLDEPGARDAWNLLRTARRFRALERTDAYRLLRWVPMPAADLSAEWFECDVVRAIVAARGVSGVSFGPRSAGSALVMLLCEAARLSAGHTSQVRGGPGALTAAMAAAARAAGAEIRTGARVEQIVSGAGGVTGVVADGQELPADAVVSAIDPKTTLLHLTDPAALPPDVLAKMRAYRSAGTMAKVNLALSALPVFSGLPPGATEPLTAAIHLGPGLDYLERAFDHVKYGEMSAEPWLDVTIPSILDPGLAPVGAHVMSVYVHHAPYRLREGTWESERANLLQRTLATLSRFSTGIEKLVVAAEAITPMDLEAHYGFNGGHIFHGELTLDQLATMRPMLGYARYESPLRGLFLCSAGTHPGGFMSGASGKMAAREVRRTLKA